MQKYIIYFNAANLVVLILQNLRIKQVILHFQFISNLKGSKIYHG